MAVTKTNFINYIRCPRYVGLDKIKKEQLDADISYADYKKEELEDAIGDILTSMYDENGEDIIDVRNEQLEIMLPFYNKVEQIAGNIAKSIFKGNLKYAIDTANQESFDAVIDGIRYLCYVDIMHEHDNVFDIIEVKATTTKKFLNLGKSAKNDFGEKDVISIFDKDEKGIYKLKEELGNNDLDPKDYLKYKTKLFDKYHEAGHYVYDLAIQRYIIEHDLKQNNEQDKINDIKYYLAVLNGDYIFNGDYKDNQPLYNKDENGNDIINFIDLTSITKDYMEKIELDRKRVDQYIKEAKVDEYPLGEYCEFKKTTKCKFVPLCFKKVPSKNSILNYIDNHHGFTDEMGNKHHRFDLLNEGKVNMLDIPESWLKRDKNVIQRRIVESHNTYINVDKITTGIKQISYPIYHLDFETFPCPLPRYKGEKPYYQSVFQFSLHIEKEPGICNKDTDHYEFLAIDHQDHREELIKKLLEHIDINSGGTILVYNESFEKTRIKELGEMFSEYKKDLTKMSNMLFDLLNIVKTKTSFYQDLGYDEETSKMFNYYHYDLNGSFSIKKVLPIFSKLNYKDLDVSNGMEALVTYASFDKLEKSEYNIKYKALLEYCKQDTWAMVEILNGLRNLVK
jgi:hypothetical protein